MRTIALRGLILLCVAFACASARADDTDDIEGFLGGIYNRYQGSTDGVKLDNAKDFAKYFDPGLAAAFEKDRMESKGEVGKLDGDPFIGAQDWDITSVAVSAQAPEDSRARATVTLQNNKKVQKISIRLREFETGWRITDISWPGQEQSLRQIMGAE
jgi:hypothetical protein